MAADGSQEEPWPRVHAINTLRLTFSHKNLANDVSGFFAQGVLHCLVQHHKISASLRGHSPLFTCHMAMLSTVL